MSQSYVATNEVELSELDIYIIQVDSKIGHLVVRGDMLQGETLELIVVYLGKLEDKIRCEKKTVNETQTPHIIVVA